MSAPIRISLAANLLLRLIALVSLLCISAASVMAQTPVLTQHNDNSRTGQNTTETILTPSNVNSTQFGRIFTLPVTGQVYAQPLYVPDVNIAGKGAHNVLIVATEGDMLYAFDADSNTGTNSTFLWRANIIDAAHGAAAGATPVSSMTVNCTDMQPQTGITSTPVIDTANGTIYLESKSFENGNAVHRIHAIDITTGNEKSPGPAVVDALPNGVPGTGDGSHAGVLQFDSLTQMNRAGLLLVNGTIFVGYASHCDGGPYHGWLFAFDEATLSRKAIFNSSPYGGLAGFWASGAGLAADSSGTLFLVTGNGTYDTNQPQIDYGDSILKVAFNGSAFTVEDYFTPFNQASLAQGDSDLGSGGILLLPDQSGSHPHELVGAGKTGAVYLVDRDTMTVNNQHYCNGCTSDPEIVQTYSSVGSVFSVPAYWNNSLYYLGAGRSLTAVPISGGTLNGAAATSGPCCINFPGSTPTISSSGTTNGIVWAIDSSKYGNPGPGPGPAVLHAYNASNVKTELYNSAQAGTRDTAGNAVKFSVPMVTNGKVYVGTSTEVDVYGLIASAPPPAATPAINPGSETVSSPVQVTLTESTAGSTIFYTTDGTNPTVNSTKYSAPFTLTVSATVKAFATASGFSNSAVASASYVIQTVQGTVATPMIIPAAGTYSGSVSVSITDSTGGSLIYYTTTGLTPTINSTPYGGAFTLTTSATVQAIAVATGFTTSAVASSAYTVTPTTGAAINFANGFAGQTSLTLNGGATINGNRLRLTDDGGDEARSAFYNTPVSVANFTSDFSFQLTNPSGDGMTFTIQGSSPTAVGPTGGGLGYGPDAPGGGSPSPNTPIAKSVAIKFDLYSNVGEGIDSTGSYTNGATPTTPSTDLTASGVNLHSGDIFNVHVVYDGTTLTWTITDATTAKTFTTSAPVNIPSLVGGTTAFVGFTAGTGGNAATQEILTWTLSPAGSGPVAAATPVITPGSETTPAPVQVNIMDATSGAVIYYTTDLSAPTINSTKYSAPFTLTTSTTVKAIAVATGFTASAIASASYVIQVAQSPAATPMIVPAAGSYNGSVSVSITDSTGGSLIYYTTTGLTPTINSTPYGGAFTLTTSATVQAIAVATGFTTSAVASSAYTVTPTTGAAINFANGFAGQTSLTLNGGATINGNRLRLTDGGGGEARSAFYNTPVNVANFTSDFSFQLTNPSGDGMTFTIQGSGPTAVGPSGGGLGYGPDAPGGGSASPNTPIAKSVAIKFDLFSNAGEGIDSTGSYTNGATPTTPSTDLTASGVNLHSGDIFNVHVVYDGTTLTWTITDATTAKTFTTSAPVNIPSLVGGTTALAGFTGGTGGNAATQEILTWTFNSAGSTGPGAPVQYETESPAVFNASHSSGPTYRVFAWGGFTNGSGTTLDGTAAGQSVSITLSVPSAGVYDVKVATKTNTNRGIVQLSVNGSNVGSATDQYNVGNIWQEYDLGTVTLAAGNQTFVFTTSGKNAASSGYTQAYDYIKLTPQ